MIKSNKKDLRGEKFMPMNYLFKMVCIHENKLIHDVESIKNVDKIR